MEILKRQKIISIGVTIVLLIGLVVGVVLVQRQQNLKSKASLQAYNAFNVGSSEPGKYVKCEGNVCETNTLNITISVRDLQALNIQEQQVVASKTDEQCKQELGEPPPFCDLNTCIKNKPVVKDNQCRFDTERVDVALCPNNCQSNGTQTILCQEYEVCERYQDGKLTGNLIKYWINEAGELKGCQEQQKIPDQNKCPVDQVLASSQYTVAGGGLTGQVSAGSAPIPFCSAQDFATPCWQGADCKEENQVYANKACSNNHGAGSKCTRSTGASNTFEDGCTQPESTAVADSCSGQYITACWQGADCKEENQASANAVCSQNHGSDSVCTRALGMGNVYEDGCTYGRGGQLAAGIKQACTTESFATSCWMEARCDETNQRFADRTCINTHGEGSICTRATGISNTNNDGCTKTVVNLAQERRARVAQSPACTDTEECDEKTATRRIYPCGQEPAIEVTDTSCSPGLNPEDAIDLNLESQRLARSQKQAENRTNLWEGTINFVTGAPGGVWNFLTSSGKNAEQAPTLGEVGQANAQALKRQIDSLFAEGRRNAEVDQEQLQKLLECQANYRQAIKEGKNPEDLQDCSSVVPQIPQKVIDEKAKEAEVCALESGDVKTCLRKTGVNMDVGEAKIAKTGICLNAFSNPNPFARCIGFTGESVVPADPSQNLSEVLRKAEVLKLAESLGLDLEKDDPKYWEKEKREFFFHAAARTDINAAKYAAEFFGIPITSWENADKAAKICAREHGNLCFVNRFNPASVAGLKDEDVEKVKFLYRGWTPSPLRDVKNYAVYLSSITKTNDFLAGKRLLGHLSPEELENVKRTYEVYQNAGEYFKENTTSGRLYSEMQTRAEVDSYIGLVSTVVDPMPVAQALSSSLKYVIVKQVWNRLSQRLGPTVARQIVGQAEDAISRGVYTAAQRNAVNIVEGEVVRILDEEGVEISARSTGSSLNFVIQNGTEPPPVIKGLIETRADPRVQQTAAEGITDARIVSEVDLGSQRLFISDGKTGFETPAVQTDPVKAVQNGIDNLVDDVGRALRGEAEPPVPAVADVAALPPSNPVLARVADDAVPGEVPLADVADGLGGVEVRLLGEASTPNPARDIVANGAANAADGVSSVLDDLAGHPCPAGPAGVQCKITANTVPSIGHPERNEDAFSHNAQRGVAGVFDGMGGHKGGEWASSRAQKLLSETIEAIDDTNPQIVEEKMRQALIDASGQISRETDPELLKPGRGYPGTTASVVKVVEHDGQQVAVIGNVGDSRVYRFRNGRLEQLTKDDDVFFSDKISREISEAQRRSDLSEEAKAKWGVRHQISQALGGPNTPDPRMSVVQLKPGDRLILTSDGVHDNLTRTEIEQILKSNPQNPSQELMEKALARSKEPNPDLYDKYGNLYYEYRPKKDDITAVVVDIPSDQASSPLQQGARGIQGAWENLRSAVSPKKVATPVSKEIRDAQSWEDFFRLVDAQGQVVGSDGTVHTASQIKKTALAVKSGNVQPEFLTRSDGVRETVEKLMSAPCPIRLGLVGVVLAQGVGGGLNPCPKNPFVALARNAGNAGKQVLDKVRDVISRESEAGLKIPQGLSENKIHDVEYTHQILRETFPSSRPEVFSTVGSSAIIYTDKNSPGVVYKVYNGYVGLSDDPLVKRISDIRYAEQEAKKLQILSQEGLAPKLVEYVPPNLTDEESRLLRDSSFGFSRPENSAMQAVTLSPAREGGQQPIIVMGKVETDGQGAIKLDRNPARKKAEIDRVVSTLERLEFYPADTELVVDKSGKIIFVDLGGMSSRPTFKGQSVREEVERNFNALLKSQLQQEKPRNILERAGDTVSGWVDNFKGVFRRGEKETAEELAEKELVEKGKIPGLGEALNDESIGGNAGPNRGAVNAFSDENGRLIFTNDPKDYPRGAPDVTFRIHVFPDDVQLKEIADRMRSGMPPPPGSLIENVLPGMLGGQEQIELFTQRAISHNEALITDYLRKGGDPKYIPATPLLSKSIKELGQGAPCPIFSLIPIAYAQGLTPCPKNPVAALWHNAQVTGRQVGDTVGGTWNGFINGAVDLVTEGTLGWVQKTKPRFNIYQELVGRKGPLVELAGPTDTGFKMVNVYKREDKFYVAQADGIQRGTDKELIVSHLRAEGVSIKLPGCDPYNYGPVSFQADATRVPLKNSSVGAIFVSCLPRDVRQKTIKQSHGALEDGGLLIWQGGVKEDIEVAEKMGFQVASLVRYEGKFPGGIKSDVYHVIFQKATSGGLEVEQVLGKTPLQTAKDTFSGWVDNVKGIFRREGKEEVKQLSEVETFLAEHGGIISSLKEADTIRTLVEAADVVRAREIIEQTLKTSAHNAGTELSEPALFELTEQIIDAHVLGRRVLDYTKRYQPEDLISLSQIADAKPITFSTSRDLPTIFNSPRTFSFTEDQTKEIIQRVEAVSQNIKVPKVGVMKEIANVIGALNAKLADPSTTVGRDQRRLINILYSTSDFPDSFYIRRLNEFFESGGKNSDLPSLLADLLAENKSRYEGFKDYWGPVIDINNLDILPVAQKKYQNYGVKLAPADPEDITWISKKEVDATGRGEAGFCPIHTCIQDSGHQYLGLVLNLDGPERSIALPEGVFYRSEAEFVNATMRVTSGELASERRTRSLAALLHESIHSQVLHQIGLYQAIPDKAMSEIVEELTERLNVSILKEVQSTKHGLLTRYDGEYSRLRSLGSTILDALSIPEDDITRFAINQDPVGYIQFVDSHLRRLDDSQYRSFIEYLYQNLKIGLSQKDLFLSRRINSVMDIRLMNEEWANNLGLIGQLGVRNFQALQKQVMNGVIPLGNREIYIDIDTFSRYIEGNITDKSAYLSSRYYSETIAGQRALSYQRPAEGMVQQGIPVAGPGIVFDSIQPKSFFEQARDEVQGWFNGIFNADKKQSLSLDLAVV